MPFPYYAPQPPAQPVYNRTLPVRNQPDFSFEIRTLDSTHFNDPNLKTRFLTQEYYEILWLKKGSAKLGIDIKTQRIHENHVVLLSPGQRCIFQPLSAVEGYSILFSQEFLFLSGRETFDLFHSAKQTNDVISPAIQLDMHLLQDIEGIVTNMLKEYANRFKSRSEALQGLLKMLIIHLSRKIDYPAICPVTGAEGELLKRFMLMINNHFSNKKMVYEYASDLFVTPAYLNEVIKKNTGFTASYHIQQRIVLEAKRFAIDPEMRMKEIAANLGYEDCAHFSKFFKTNSGVNFTNFRKQLYAIRD